MKKTFSALFIALLTCTCAFAQETLRLQRTEDDGFKWYSAFYKGDANTSWAEDTQGRTLIAPVKNHSVIYMNGRFQLMTEDGDMYKAVAAYLPTGEPVIAPGRYDEIVFLDYGGYYSVIKNGKYGACDADGRELVAPTYSDLITIDGEGGLKGINSRGEYVSLNVSLKNPQRLPKTAPRKKEKPKKPGFSEIMDMYDEAVAYPSSDAEGKLRKFMKVVEADPDDSHGFGALAYNNMGCIYGDAGNIGKAIESFEKALALRPAYAQAQDNLNIMKQRQEIVNTHKPPLLPPIAIPQHQ